MDKMNSLAQFLRANSISLVNGGIALTTLGGQQLFSLLAYNCPCAVTANYAYGVVAIGVPALLLLALGWTLNPTAWLLLGDCCRRGRGSAPTPLGALLGALLGVATRAAVAPLTWIAVSLLSGDFYVCAASEFRSPGEFVRGGGGVAVTPSRDAPRHDLAAVPCKGEPLGLNLAPGFSRDAMLRQLKYESQLMGWILIGSAGLILFFSMCVRACISPMGHLQATYLSQYLDHEARLFEQTSEVHARSVAANNVRRFFGFLRTEEKGLPVESEQNLNQLPGDKWEKITGLCHSFQNNKAYPFYSRLQQWAIQSNNKQGDDVPMMDTCT
ncbi:calcium homeostasis modulator protein 2-like isoform X2 [Lethenteron reissneri]|uniref:calcium homeostasis modulator protein 2-like isoform X2 n=1 Tax=Lethenteron reissneri TaxID=7753 RepID=UPI002AB7B1D2|nr:calcium homeostasis modulator protein 2-like isoform X2 [Lethenteron reissneri]